MKAPPDATPCRSATSWRGWAPTRILTFGLPDDYFTTYTARVRSLSVSDVDKAAREVVHPEQLVWVVVGDRSKVEAGIREIGWGAVQLLDADGNVLK